MSALIKGTPELAPHFHPERAQRADSSVNPDEGPHRTLQLQGLDRGLPASTAVVLNHPDCGILLALPEQTKTEIFHVLARLP